MRDQPTIDQLQSSSTLAFARSLFHAAEGRELFEREFTSASAVSTYYSLFHLGGALIVAYCSHPAPNEDHDHTLIRNAFEKAWQKGPRTALPAGYSSSDPAEAVQHEHVPKFLQRQLPEISRSLGCRGKRGTLMDMREFVSYAPRMLLQGHTSVLYSGCQYEADDFKQCLNGHLEQIDGFFHSSVRWMSQKGYKELYSRVLSGDFVLYEFAGLRSYYPKSVVERAWAIYRSICEHEDVDWRIWRGDPDPGIFQADEPEQRERYAEAIRGFGS